MAEALPAVLTAAVGVVLLAVLVMFVVGPVRRFTRARTTARRQVTKQIAALRAVAGERHHTGELTDELRIRVDFPRL
jgi:uncharacterized membrane protein